MCIFTAHSFFYFLTFHYKQEFKLGPTTWSEGSHICFVWEQSWVQFPATPPPTFCRTDKNYGIEYTGTRVKYLIRKELKSKHLVDANKICSRQCGCLSIGLFFFVNYLILCSSILILLKPHALSKLHNWMTTHVDTKQTSDQCCHVSKFERTFQ